jgi:hypothetical protein
MEMPSGVRATRERMTSTTGGNPEFDEAPATAPVPAMYPAGNPGGRYFGTAMPTAAKATVGAIGGSVKMGCTKRRHPKRTRAIAACEYELGLRDMRGRLKVSGRSPRILRGRVPVRKRSDRNDAGKVPCVSRLRYVLRCVTCPP